MEHNQDRREYGNDIQFDLAGFSFGAEESIIIGGKSLHTCVLLQNTEIDGDSNASTCCLGNCRIRDLSLNGCWYTIIIPWTAS
jgi:hypothetical protein